MIYFLSLFVIFFTFESFAQIDYKNCLSVFNKEFQINEESKIIISPGMNIKSQDSTESSEVFVLTNPKNKEKLKITFTRNTNNQITKIVSQRDHTKLESDQDVGLEADFEFIQNKCHLIKIVKRSYIKEKKSVENVEELTKEDCIKATQRFKQCNPAKLNCSEELEKLPQEEKVKMFSKVRVIKGEKWKMFGAEGIIKGSESFIGIFNLKLVCGGKFSLTEETQEIQKEIKIPVKRE